MCNPPWQSDWGALFALYQTTRKTARFSRSPKITGDAPPASTRTLGQGCSWGQPATGGTNRAFPKGVGILRAWKQWQREAGIARLYSFHALRYSHVSHALNNGIPVHHMSAQAGHASPDVTLRIYSDPNPVERKVVYEKHNPDDAI